MLGQSPPGICLKKSGASGPRKIYFREHKKLRINKYLASCGIASRRNCEQIISDGRVAVNGKTVTALATEIDEETDKVSVDGKKVEPIHKHIYIMLNKPKGYISTTSDEKGRTHISHRPARLRYRGASAFDYRRRTV